MRLARISGVGRYVPPKIVTNDDLSAVMEELQGIAARDRYCNRPRGFEQDCETLYRDVDLAIDHVREVRSCCFV